MKNDGLKRKSYSGTLLHQVGETWHRGRRGRIGSVVIRGCGVANVF